MNIKHFFSEIFGQRRSHFSKTRLLIRILIMLAFLWVVFSALTRAMVLMESEEEYLRIAVTAPLSGEHEGIGRSMRRGVQFYLESINAGGGIRGTKFTVAPFDDADSAEGATAAAGRIAADPRVVGVVGHWSGEAIRAGGRAHADNGVPIITPASGDPQAGPRNPWLFRLLPDDPYQSRFLANYVRNVLGQKLVSIIREPAPYGERMADEFEQTYRRFGTAVRYQWSLDADATEGSLDAIVAELVEKKDAGTLFLAMDGHDGARLTAKLRGAGVRNPIVGLDGLATNAFQRALADAAGERDETLGRFTDEMVVTAPLLFDTANETAQNFRVGYRERFGEDPDWIAAYAYDAARLLLTGYREATNDDAGATATRAAIQRYLNGLNREETALEGVTGATWFDADGQAEKPLRIGVYNGASLVAALTQLQPIRSGRRANYIDELRKGRVLYVNDRFMYKTNVVYTGIRINEVKALDLEKNQYELDLLIWFRYRGKFEPQRIQFANAVEPIVLEEPEESREEGGMSYRLYRVDGPFTFDFSDTYRTYGSHVVGVSFAHESLNRNNLLYVVDLLGMGLDGGGTLLEQLESDRSTRAVTSDWNVDRAWISQDIAGYSTRGDPAYVGFGADDPLYSRIDLGILLKPAEINLRDFVPRDYFVYLAIFGVLGTIFAVLMDRKEKGRYWRVQSWGLRVVAWPMALMALGNILLDWSFHNLDIQYMDMVTQLYQMLWWLVPARLLGIAIERFLWHPLEESTRRIIPNVVRVFVSVVIYSFAMFGIIAFVFGQQLTSVLASTGLLAMIVGLAIQANISNIFSGIVLNIERPFNVGDWIKIGDIEEGRVEDITWRTTRVRNRFDHLYSVPNANVSESIIENYSTEECTHVEFAIHLEADTDPELGRGAILEGLKGSPGVMEIPRYDVWYMGVESREEGWKGRYWIHFNVEDYSDRLDIEVAAISRIYAALRRHDIAPVNPPGFVP